MKYYRWQEAGTPHAPYTKASPNLMELWFYLKRNNWGSFLGCYVYRVVTGGTLWSTHAWGAALDWGYGKDRARALAVIDFLILNHVKLGVQMIVDEAYDRTWKCWRDESNGPGWKDGNVTGGGTWLHIETDPDNWSNPFPIEWRLTAPPIPPTPPQPTYPPSVEIPLEDNMKLIEPPARAYDTRSKDGPMKAGETRVISIGYSVPGAQINLVAVQPGSDGYMSVWGSGPKPNSSALNYTTGENVANCVPVHVVDGAITVYSSAACHLIVDVFATMG